MEYNKNNIELEEIIVKNRDSETSKDELIKMLAEILVDAFIWQHKNKSIDLEEQIPRYQKKKQEDQSFYL